VKRAIAIIALMLVYGAQHLWPQWQALYDWLVPVLLAFGGLGVVDAKRKGKL
jgi:hypothetical protein